MYWSFSEVARRHGDRVMLGAAAVLQTGPEGRVETARLVYMNAGPTRMIGRRAAELLLRHQLEPEVIEEAANLAAREIDPPHDVHATSDYRRHLAVVLTRRVLLDIQRQIEERADVP
jgi:CO/xanthine dehydrogenase FAD-binding subunit